ncbi:histidine phosphatase family protein [Pseudomaricurvus alcaniphilus]|uniref:histidine phosphatase family protein n=1 Tax=Pseudomaricurvus alcaniphilus TaxID=1166482 RepID=UPI00140B8529|nr:histidine phosphatase family protein [Pseudomaricurvus alcaniphilus]NHN37252.1 histidine phosphatase family protein [Pseudomaricurvus alcaniphilus]
MQTTEVNAAPEALAVTTIDLLRHGACEGGAILRGRTDSPLAAEGHRQMQAALAPHGGWQAVVSSPLQRCHSFATDFARRNGLPLQLEQDWQEVNFGCWEGKTPAAIYAADPELADRYYRLPGSVTPSGAEPLAEARDRIMGAWRSLLRSHCGQHVLVVSHGGAIRLLLTALQNAPLSASQFFQVPHASLTRLQVHGGADDAFMQLLFHGHTGATARDCH